MRVERISAGRSTTGGAKGRLVRRLTHCLISLGAVYYWIPAQLPVLHISKWVILALALLATTAVECWRLRRSRLMLGMRPHERGRVASYFYAVTAGVLVLTFFPMEIGVPAMVAMALTDPIVGEVRLRTGSELFSVIVSAACYGIIAATILLAMEIPGPAATVLLLVMTPVAVASEAVDIGGLDDDFTMLLFPALVGGAIWVLLA